MHLQDQYVIPKINFCHFYLISEESWEKLPPLKANQESHSLLYIMIKKDLLMTCIYDRLIDSEMWQKSLYHEEL